MNKILMCFDYNDTIDDLRYKCSLCENYGNGKIPTFLRGVLSMATATKSSVSMAIITSAPVTDIKDEISEINFYASSFSRRVTNGDNLIKYIIGNKNKELYNCDLQTSEIISEHGLSKKEGVETILNLPEEQDVNLVITGGDSKEDIEMLKAETNGIPNIFLAPKINKDVLDERYENESIIRDSKNKNSDAIGNCLITLSKNLENYSLIEQFTSNAPQITEDEFVQ